MSACSPTCASAPPAARSRSPSSRFRLHLPDHPVLPVAAGLRAAGDRGADSAGGPVHRGWIGAGNAGGGDADRHQGGGVRRADDARRGLRLGGDRQRRRVLSAGRAADGAARRWAGPDHGAGHRLDHGRGPPRTGRRRFGGQRRDRQIGGTLGVAVVGSIFSTLYIHRLSESAILRAAPQVAQDTAREGLAQGWRSPRSHRLRWPRRCARMSATRSCPACTPGA